MKQEFFIERYNKLGWKFSDVVVKKTLRVNTLKISKTNLYKRLSELGVKLKEIPSVRNGFSIEKTNFSLGSAAEYLLGYYYMQESSAQYTSELLNPREGELVLDCCAAPGGKTTHLSQLMRNKGVLIALDKKSNRLIALKNNIERLGCKNIIVYNMDALDIKKLDLTFDRILLDAPCSGNFTQEFGWFEKRDLEGIKQNAENQRKLLTKCYEVLREKGSLVYSTCSLEPEENEENMKWFEKNFNVKVVEQKRFWPSEENQGFFVAKIIKK